MNFDSECDTLENRHEKIKKSAFIEVITDLYLELDQSQRTTLLAKYGLTSLDIFAEACKRSCEESEWVIQSIIYSHLENKTKSAHVEDNQFLTHYPLILMTSYPHTIVNPICGIIEYIFREVRDLDTIRRHLQAINEDITFINFVLKTLDDKTPVRKRITSMILRVLETSIDCDEALKIINIFSAI